MKVSFSLAKKSNTTSTNAGAAGAAPPLRQPAAFASLDDEPVDAAPTASTSTRNLNANKALAAQAAGLTGMSKALKKKIEKEQNVDSSVYQYDEVWDRMQEAKAREKEKKEIEAKERKPKYIGSLLQAATVRKLDHLRAEEKMIQREREMEGDEFADKESFVTQAYKDQMAEVRRAEEEEKQREELEKKKRGPATGMTHFYRQLLERSEKEHSETIAATLPTTDRRPVVGPAAGPPGQNLTISRPKDDEESTSSPDFTPVSDLERAIAARAEGKTVELNDDNQIVDKRELLSAGLNLSAPNTRRLGGLGSSKTASRDAEQKGEDLSHRAVGLAASRKEINERRQREIHMQLEEEKDRVTRERELAEAARVKRTIAKRNTEEDVKSARERYLERKRRRIEEAAAGEGVGTDTPHG